MQVIQWVDVECIGCLLIDIKVGESLEDLFQRCLTDGVLLDPHVGSLRLNLSKQVSNGFIFSGHSHLVEVTTLLHQLDLAKLPCNEFNEFEAKLLGVQEFHQVLHPDCRVGVKLCFHSKVISKTSNLDLLKNQSIVPLLGTSLNS